jgi:ribokinase
VKVFCIGDSSVNVFLQIPCETDSVSLEAKKRLMQFRLGSKTQLENEVVTVGGNAFNMAVGLARQKIEVDLFSILGSDHDGKRIEKFLDHESEKTNFFPLSFPRRRESMLFLNGVKTNVGYVMEFQSERFILVDTSSKNYELRTMNHELTSEDWVFLSSVGPNYRKFFQEVLDLKKRIGFKLSYNPSSNEFKNDVSTFLDVVKNSDVLFVNKKEASKILTNTIQYYQILSNTNKNSFSSSVIPAPPLEGQAPAGIQAFSEDIDETINKLWEITHKIVVVTDGIRGSCVFDGVRNYFEPSSQEPAVEKTGAGDAFESGFLAEYLKTGDIQSAMKSGTENAASVIKFVGAVKGLLYK